MCIRKNIVTPPAALLLFLTVFFAFCSLSQEIKNSACMECHADKTLTRTNSAGKEVSCFVDLAKLAASVYRTNTCASCHSDITIKHPDDNVPAKPINCRSCHQKESESYGLSVHGVDLANGQLNSAN